ncbi:MAG: fumarylacetoacetase, partial [Paracoccaceae bacterium]|nr:fumarylacetoacetase [Paracoccaceae bacterium]
MTLSKSWVASANDPNTDFPLNNLPCGVFSVPDGEPRCGVAIGDMILDVTALEEHAILRPSDEPVFDVPFWNDFMELGPEAWARFRADLTALLAEGAAARPRVEPHLVKQADATMHMPFAVAEFTDFYAGRHH